MQRLLLVCLLFASVLSVVPPMPAFIWSGSSGILRTLNHEAPTSFSTSSIVEIIKRSSGHSQELKPELESLFVKGNEAPELVVVFVHPELHTSQVSALSAAFQKQSDGGAFKNLKTWLGTAAGSLTLPYVYQTADQSLLEELKAVDNVHFVHAEDGPAFLHSHSHILNNGKADVVVLTFNNPNWNQDLKTKLQRDDSIMNQVVEKINKGSKGKFVAFVTANTPSQTVHKSTQFAQDLLGLNSKAYLKSEATYSSSNTTLYMTPALLSSLSISLLLLLISCCGVGGLMALKTPDMFEGEGGYLAGN